jgi:hypothetical protein
MRSTWTCAAVLAAALAPMAVQAQGRGEPRPPRPGPPPGAGGPGFAVHMAPIEPAKGAPFRAQSIHEHVETLGDGNRIARTTTTSVWRDSEGRTRREMDGHAFIDDPVAGTGYVLDAETKTAMRRPPFPSRRPADAPAPSREASPARDKPGAEESVALGTRTIEGLDAVGTRNTLTIPAGRIGNERPILVVSERWYAPELQAVVVSSHNDPRSGRDTLRLTGITRGEPDKSLFEVPEGYTVRQGPPPFLHGPGPGRPQEQP